MIKSNDEATVEKAKQLVYMEPFIALARYTDEKFKEPAVRSWARA